MQYIDAVISVCMHLFRFVHITTRVVSVFPANFPPTAKTFMSVSTISRVTVNMVLPVGEPIKLMNKKGKQSYMDAVGRICKTFKRSTEINSSS